MIRLRVTIFSENIQFLFFGIVFGFKLKQILKSFPKIKIYHFLPK